MIKGAVSLVPYLYIVCPMFDPRGSFHSAAKKDCLQKMVAVAADIVPPKFCCQNFAMAVLTY